MSIDLLPHPDMFTDANFLNLQEGSHKKDEDGAKRVFFGGERFIEGISGEAYVCTLAFQLILTISPSIGVGQSCFTDSPENSFLSLTSLCE